MKTTTLTFAVAGKGGTGKTTVAGLITWLLIERAEGPVLAIDADPNANFNEILGLEVQQSIGGLREEVLEKINELPPGVSKDTYLEYGLHQCLVEGEGIDLLVMGRGEGPKCYCMVNHVLRKYIDILRQNYRYVVIDNEAGMEHLSRRTTQDVDFLLIISDESPIAIRAAARINELANELKLRVGERYLILNNLQGNLSELAREEIKNTGLTILGEVPQDEAILKLSLQGRSLGDLASASPARSAVEEMLNKLLMKSKQAVVN